MSTTATQPSPAPSPTSLHLPTTAQTLRAELKTWEASFAATNHGRKPGRDDIKHHPETARKYKAYHQLRARVPSSALPPRCASSTPPPRAEKRKRLSPEEGPPPSAPPHTQTVSSPSGRPPPSAMDPDDPSTPTPARTVVGPTPQKNGRVLGLFDGLSPKRTPSKADPAPASSRLADTGSRLLATPSKQRFHPASTAPSPDTHTPHSTRTRPASTSTSTSIHTPPTRRRTLQQTPTAARTPAPQPSPSDTPAFLRRSAPLFPHPPANNTLSGPIPTPWSPVAPRLPRKPTGRSLSTLAQGLRAMEEAALDEELDLLREMEGGEARGVEAKVLVGDSQVGDMPLGPDRGGEGSGEEEGEGEGEARAGRTWRKKGQKRSTRRVVMRPVVGRWVPEREWVGGVVEEEGQGEGVVRETQGGDGGELGVEEGGVDEENTGEKGQEEPEEKKAKAPRKVSATAHANFRALKIRNKHSKGKKGGRFGRR
ncbi:DNA replication regulator sld2 [Xylographa vitiligo]|nr:DNA replication regulator sld2 [Xylographa vitiligo]